MNLKMKEWMKEYVVGQDETPTEYVNRLVDSLKLMYPVYGGVRRGDRYYYVETGRFSINFTLTPENKQKLYQLRSYKNIYADRIRYLIGADFERGETKPQREISYQDFFLEVAETPIPLEEINEYCDYEYEVVDDIEEFTRKVLKTRTHASKKKDIIHYSKTERRGINYRRISNSLGGDISLGQFSSALKKEVPGFGFLTTPCNFPREHMLSCYDREIVEPGQKMTGVYQAYTSDDGSYLLPYPKIFEADLTSRRGPVLEWSGHEFWALEGHIIPESWFEDPQEITKEDILKTQNTERRRVLVNHIGIERFTRMMDLETIDEGKYGNLVKCNDGITDIYFVQVTCPSTNRQYHLGFHPRVLPHRTEVTADAAVAWTFRMTEEEYQPAVET